MHLWGSSTNEVFGCVTLQEGDKTECWFFHSYEQAKEITCKITGDQKNTDDFLGDVTKSRLLKTSEIPPLCIEGRVAHTITWLMGPLANLSQGNMFQVTELDPLGPKFYFLLTPRKEDKEPNALLGFRDEQNHHQTFVFYSKEQGKELLGKYCGWVKQPLAGRIQKVLAESFLPENSSTRTVKIGEPVSGYLHVGYVMIKQAGG